MNLQIAIVAIRLTRQQALNLLLVRLLAQFRERGFRLGRDFIVTFRFGEFDQLGVFLKPRYQRIIAGYASVKASTLAHNALGILGIVPEVRVFGESVQFVETSGRGIVVKDASSAAAGTASYCRSRLALRPASGLSGQVQ